MSLVAQINLTFQKRRARECNSLPKGGSKPPWSNYIALITNACGELIIAIIMQNIFLPSFTS